MSIGRTNAIGGKMKMVTGNISFSSQRDGYTDYTIDYAVIPASLIGFTPKIVLIGYTAVANLAICYLDEKVIYGNAVFPYIVFPDGTAQYFSGTYSLKQIGASTDMSYTVLGGTQYAYSNHWGRNAIWFHDDGSLRLAAYRNTSSNKTQDVTYIAYG